MDLDRLDTTETAGMPEAYFSVSHLLRYCVVLEEDGRQTWHSLVIKGASGGRLTKFQSVGGAAKLTKKGKQVLMRRYGHSIRFQKNDEEDDFRFHLRYALGERDSLRHVLDEFETLNPALFEDSPHREFREELVLGDSLHQPVLSEEEFTSCSVEYCGHVSLMDTESRGSSVRAKGGEGYFRIFHLHDLFMSPVVFSKLSASES